ncbi:Gmad2 immunoglobulin-like domain-containing protein [Bacillus sp. USDA818B3_A]|uniref:Gmad2 immunoglobulin-like domain-containing protein n=1 Tax=Bacillus sp. USDA818B3_A TaxID=2698834 RepID=UPI00136C1161|nr:Gmad2 immunoglobulin-like domain-containing protein [Bacillus sp. USDA818B3_A]
MKKFAYLCILLTVMIGLAGCNQKESANPDKPASPVQDGPKNPDKPTSSGEDGPAIPDKPSTNGEDKPSSPESPVPENKVYQNNIFKDVVVTETGEKIIVKGKAQVFEGVFQYTLYDGDKVVIENHYQTDGAPAWGEFEITFDKDAVSTDQAKIELFNYSAKDGSKENILEIPISK